MRTIEITSIEDVRDGDVVTVKLPALPLPTTVTGHVYIAQGAGIVLWDVPGVGEIDMDCWSFVSATREVPEWEPGTAGTATVRGVKGARLMLLSANRWVSPHVPTHDRTGSWIHTDQDVTDFVPDDASRWAAQAKLVEVDLDNARAEVERLTAEVERLRREALKYKEAARKYQREHEKECAEVNRLRAARLTDTTEEK